MALVSSRFFFLLLVVLLPVLLTGCGGEQEEAGMEGQVEEMEAMEPESIYLQQADSLRWLSYLSFSPQDTALAYVMLAALYLSNQYPEAALHYLDEAGRFDLDRPVIYLNMGYAYNMMGDFERASEAFHMFVQRDPGSILSQEIFRIVEKYRAITSEPPE
jgi:tetratricopeptide (TPR) repeat protein